MAKKKKQTYIEQLNDPRWIQLRNRVLARDNATCQYCGCQNKRLQVHHKTYLPNKAAWEYPESNLITLCDKCHKEITFVNKNLYAQFLKTRNLLRDVGFSDNILFGVLDYVQYDLNDLLNGIKHNNNYFFHIAKHRCSNYQDRVILARLGFKDILDIDFCFDGRFTEQYSKIKPDLVGIRKKKKNN